MEGFRLAPGHAANRATHAPPARAWWRRLSISAVFPVVYQPIGRFNCAWAGREHPDFLCLSARTKNPALRRGQSIFNSYLISFFDLLDHRRKAESGIELDPACLPIEVVVHCCCEVCGFLPSMNTASAGSLSPFMTPVVLSCDRGHRIPRPLRQLGTETTPSGEQSYADVAIHGQDVTALSVPR